MTLRTFGTTVGSLLVLWVGWLLLAMAWALEPFVVSPQPVHLTRQVVSVLTG